MIWVKKACSGMRKMENIRMFILNGMEIIWLYGAITMGDGGKSGDDKKAWI